MESDKTTRGDRPVRGKAAGGAKTPAKQYNRPRGGGAKPISDLMPQIGRSAFRRFGFVQSSVVSRWPEIVGEAPIEGQDVVVTRVNGSLLTVQSAV